MRKHQELLNFVSLNLGNKWECLMKDQCKSRALTITDIEKTAFCDVSLPTIGAEDVLIKTEYVGLCGSDINTYKGLNPLVSLPRIPGHEISGKIVKLGDNVPQTYQTGQAVTLSPYTSCGHCRSCQKGRINACEHNKTLGVQQDGALATYFSVHFSKLVTSPNLSLKQLALVEPLAVGFHAVNRAHLDEGDFAVVFGCGAIGLGAIAALRAKGIKTIAVDLSNHKLDIAHKLGAKYLINPSEVDVLETIKSYTNNQGVDLAVEAVGLPLTFQQCVDVACFGGQIVYIGYAKEKVCYDSKFFNLKELTIMGSRNATIQDMQDVIRYIEHHKDIDELLISKIFPFDAADQAFSYWKAHTQETLKILIEFNEF